MRTSAWVLGMVTGVVVLGGAVGARAEDQRPRAFEPHVTPFAGASGFAVSGCFPQNCPEPVKVQETAQGPKVSDELNPCATRVMDNFDLNLAHVQHPPLTPEERGEVSSGGARCGELAEKQRRNRDLKHEVRMTVRVGMSFFAVERFELAAKEGDAPARVSDASLKASGWRPWLTGLSPVKLTAQLRPITAAPGSQAVGVVELCFNRYQMRPCAFGWVRLAGREPLWVMAGAHWNPGPVARPAWHRWMPPGREDGDQWQEDCDRPAPAPTREPRRPSLPPANPPARPPIAQPTPAPTPTARPPTTPPTPAPTTQPNTPPKGNNGVGNGEDGQPPGNPPVNDGAGTSPGNPGNQGGANGNGNTTKGNNGVGNGTDPQPPGNPKVNDGAGTSPGNPGNKTGGRTLKK